jgi:hypothetical protein
VVAQQNTWVEGGVPSQMMENPKMDIFEQLKASSPMLVIVVVGVVALFLAIKIGHAILRLVFGLIGLAAIVGAVWWLFLKH